MSKTSSFGISTSYTSKKNFFLRCEEYERECRSSGVDIPNRSSNFKKRGVKRKKNSKKETQKNKSAT